jgi:hypothetical protein
MICRMRGNNGGPAAAVPQWGRRKVLTLAGVGAASVLAGCRVRLEDDAPRVPLLPTREPVADEPLLLQTLTECRALQARAAALGGARTASAARLAVVHGRQVDVLEQVLRDARVPESAYAATPAPTSSAVPSAGSPPTPSRARLAAQEALAVQPAALVALAAASARHLPLLSALTVQRAVATTFLRGPVRWPSSTAAPVAAAPELLTAVRSAVYGFEVVAAQSNGAARARAVGVLATLRPHAEQLEVLAGPRAAAPPLGYDLPFPVTTPAAATRLARSLLRALLLSVGSAFEAGAEDVSALTGLLRWGAEIQTQALAWGAAPTAFPGLATP